MLGAASSDAITENAWWFDWNLELQRFTNRVSIYLAFMDDRYPSTDQQQSVHLDYVYPDAARDLNRWLPHVKSEADPPAG